LSLIKHIGANPRDRSVPFLDLETYTSISSGLKLGKRLAENLPAPASRFSCARFRFFTPSSAQFLQLAVVFRANSGCCPERSAAASQNSKESGRSHRFSSPGASQEVRLPDHQNCRRIDSELPISSAVPRPHRF